MKLTSKTAILAFALSVAAAPIENDKRQFGAGTGTGDALPSLSLPAGGSPISTGTGSPGGTSGGLGGLGGSSTGGLGGLGGSSTGGFGGFGGSSTGGLDGLSGSSGGLDSGSLGGLSGSLTKRQLSGTGEPSSLTTGLSGTGSSSGLGGASGLGSVSSSGGLGSFGGLTGGSSSLGGLPSGGLGGLGGGSSTSGLGSLRGSSSTSGLGVSSFGTPDVGGLTGSSTTSLKERQTGGLGGLGSLGGSSSTGGFDLGSLTGSTSGSAAGSTSAGTAAGDASGSSGGCKAVSLLFARGTGETGTMGTVIGPPLADALANALGADKVSSEGVNYPADAGGNANLGGSGGPAMASQAQAILSSCPDTKLVLSGYSQGAMVVHNALSSQGLEGSKVAAVVAFGDPLNGQAFEGVDDSKAKEFCGSSDFLCSSGGTTGSGSHISYTADAEAAAEFIVQATGAGA